MKPISINTRGYWEFQLNISGRSKPKILDNALETWKEDHNFWISTPDSIHGWTSTERTASEIAVFHFSDVPESISKIFQGRTTISTKVDQESLDSVLLMAKEMAPQVMSPNYISLVQFDICCHQLILLFLKNTDEQLENIPWNHNTQIVSASIAWYCSNMNEGVGIQETAVKMGYSVSQLRKIFIKTKGMGPNKIFEDCRMNRAKELIQHGYMSILEISLECGYSDQSSFSRAFKKYYLYSPIQYRKNLENQGVLLL